MVPAGIPISQALLVSQGAGAVKRVLDIIDAVHRDGQLPKLPVVTISSPTTAGKYTGRELKINLQEDRFDLVTVHEIGHFLDHRGIGSPHHLASRKSRLLAEWRRAVENTRAVSSLARLKTRRTGEIELADGTKIPRPVNVRYVKYLLDRPELFARSYAQYIAARSGDAQLLKQLDEIRHNRADLYRARQWETDDFAPVMEALDNLMVRLGWQKRQ